MLRTLLRGGVVAQLVSGLVACTGSGNDDVGGTDEGGGTGTATDDGEGGASDGSEGGTDDDPAGPDGDDDGAPEEPHALGTIVLGEARLATGGGSTPIVTVTFIPDADGVGESCAQEVAGCRLLLAPDCGDAGCGDGEYCSFDDTCQAACEQICDAGCAADEVCYFPAKGDAACKPLDAFDAGTLTFGGTTTPLSLSPPYTFEGGSGAPFSPGAALSVDASGASNAGFEPFTREFTGTATLQTDLEFVGPVTGVQAAIPVTWSPGSAAMTLTAVVKPAGQPPATLSCEVDDATGSFSLPAAAIEAALAGGALSTLTLTLTRERVERHFDLATTGTLSDATVQDVGWLELKTTSSESHAVEVCADNEDICDGACVDTSSDTSHCGECGFTCPENEVCQMGVCAGGDSCLACVGTAVTECPAEAATCFANPECNALYSCLQGCGVDLACVLGCQSSHADGQADYQPLGACMMQVCEGPCDFPGVPG